MIIFFFIIIFIKTGKNGDRKPSKKLLSQEEIAFQRFQIIAKVKLLLFL